MIAYTTNGRVGTLTLDAPPLNEIGTALVEALEGFLAGFDPAAVDALVVASARPGGFSAGADLRELHAGLAARPEAEHDGAIAAFLDRVHAVMDALDALPVATIAAIHGVCFGGGLELALTCDLRVADKSARFAFPELRLGLVPGFGGIPRLERDVGGALARDLVLSGRSLGAERAHAAGLVHQLVGRGQALAVAERLAAQVTRFDAEARREAKALLKAVPTERLAAERAVFRRLIARPAVRRALADFAERTDPLPYLPRAGAASPEEPR